MGDVFPARNITYDELTSWAGSIGIVADNPATEYLNYINTTYPEADVSNAMLEYSGAYLDFDVNADGTYNVWGYKTNYGTSAQYNPVNSNSGQIARAELRQAVNSGTTVSQGQTVKNISTQPVSGGFAQNAVYVLSEIGAAASAASVGIALGKWIDQELYNANPDYWDSIGLSTLNPETWGSLTAGSDSPFAGMLNAILGINPATGESQLYMDEEAVARFALTLAQNGWFASAPTSVAENYEGFTFSQSRIFTFPLEFAQTSRGQIVNYDSSYGSNFISTNPAVYMSFLTNGNPNNAYLGSYIAFSNQPFLYGSYSRWYVTPSGNAASYTINGETYYVSSGGPFRTTNSQPPVISTIPVNVNNSGSVLTTSDVAKLAYLTYHHGTNQTIQGVSDQPNSQAPTGWENWVTPQDALTGLQQQYPNMFGNPLTFDAMQPDGTIVQHKYVPVNVPDIAYNNDQHPIAKTQLQGQTLVDPTTSTDTLLQLLTDLVTATQTQTQPQEQIPPDNPVDTGTGSSPVPTPPTGSASALWSVYHPTQAQVDAFGGWLWSTSFVDQLIKVFENPMDAIISLHKVFVTPVDAGTTTIHAGHLDSNVPSAYVTQQYVFVDCGYVNCYEQFGNVFDYVGTTLSLYLPFIGIVPLNVDDVMRSTIHIKYGCDLFTGAILAQVEIQRDGHNAVLYQYGGDGAVMYPVSGSRSSSFLTGLMATLGAAASVAVSGGATLPVMAAGVGGAIASAQKQVQHSGGFSGNSGAMGCKIPYLIIERPQTKIATLFPRLEGYPTNYSVVLGNCQNHVVCSSVHVRGMTATQPELEMIEELLRSGVEI